MFYLIKYFIPILIYCSCTTNPPQKETPSQEISLSNEPIKINWLKNIKTTNRISSNHYSDFVIDKKGDSYIACFFMENKKDYIYIVKVDKDGNIIWEINKPNLGRATAITIDSKDNIWVSGYSSGTLDFGDQVVNNNSGGALFLAQFNTDGKCLQIITSGEPAVGYNVNINAHGDILLNGTCGRQLTIKDQTILKSEDQSDRYFITLFDENGNCQLLKYFPLNIIKMKSDADGNFYLSGNFNENFEYDGFKGTTENFYDNNAFLMKIKKDGSTEWLKQYGAPGNRRQGYRSDEGFNDFVLENNGDITVFGLSEKNHPQLGLDTLAGDKSLKTVIAVFDKNGEIKNEKVIAKHPYEGSIQTITKNAKGDYFLTFNAKPNFILEGERVSFEGEFRSVILRYNNNWELIKMQQPTNETDALFRVAKNFDGHVYYSGHYRKELSIGQTVIQNDGGHTLFMMQLE